jgi:GNAT superfamily N-acetyltransferase
MQEPARTVLREATEDDHAALLALEGSSPHTGAELLQARTDFFARTDAYSLSQVLVAEREGAVIGVECLALTDVRVNGGGCMAGYSFNTRIQPGLQRKGLGPSLLVAAEGWAEEQGAAYLTGLIKTTNAPSMKMVTALGFETVARFDYLVLELARFDGMTGPRAVRVDLGQDPYLLELRMDAVRSHHFVPLFLEKELFSPQPEGAYAGSWTASGRHGTAWLSIWDDRTARGLNPATFSVVKAFDLMLEGPGALGAFAGIVVALRARGIHHLLVPLPAESYACSLLTPFAAEVIDMNFVVKRLRGSPPVRPGPIYFDIRH